VNVHRSCHCGRIIFSAEVDPKSTSNDRQKLSGTDFRFSFTAVSGSVQLAFGQPKIYVKVVESGSLREIARTLLSRTERDEVKTTN